MKFKNLIIPKGIFSKLYRLKNNSKKCIVYNTPFRSITILDDDSAEVWQLIYNRRGDISKAYEYIIKNGKFQNIEEAKNTLLVFIENLKNLGLLKDGNKVVDFKNQVVLQKEITINEKVNPFINTELSIGQLMADNHILYSLVIELTYRCNEKCIHCYCPSERNIPEMSHKVIEQLLLQFKNLGGYKIQLTGGELFLRKDIKEILYLFRNNDIVLDITSNLTLMNDDIFEIIKGIYPRSIGCSIYSARPDLHDKITGLKGSFEKSINSIKKLRSNDIPVIIKTPLMSDTVKYWEEIEILANNLGCEYQLDLNITAKNDGEKEPMKYRVKDINILMDIMSSKFYKLFINDEPTQKLNTLDTNANLCGAGASGLAISPNGIIRPCIGLLIKIGCFPYDSLEKVWNESNFFTEWSSKKLVDIKQCSNCEKIAFCNRCPGVWQLENSSYDIPSEYTCFLADIWSRAQKK